MDFKRAGAIALKCGDLSEAARCFDAAIAGDVRDWESIAALASINLDMGRTGEAFALFERAYDIHPDAKVLSDLGRVLTIWGEYSGALKYFTAAHEMDPKNVPAMNNAAMACTSLGLIDEAAEWLTKARTNLEWHEHFNEDYTDVDRNWAMIHLMRQDWREGWKAYDLGLGKGDRIERGYGAWAQNRWSPMMGGQSKVVVYGEQGLGDELLFASCIPDLMKDCGNVIIETMPRLVGVFSRSFPEATVYGTRYDQHPHWVEAEKPDAKLAMGQLPGLYRNEQSDFPGTPYVKPNPQMVAMIRGLLEPLPRRKKVGLAWSGGTVQTGYMDRQVPLADLAKAFENIDAELISLQHTLGDERPEEHGIYVFPQITHRDLDYEWTMALLSELDVVVSVPTAAVHAAGAVGTKTLVMLNDHAQWRCGGPTMPWWNSVEVMRDWTLESVAGRLGEVLDGSG